MLRAVTAAFLLSTCVGCTTLEIFRVEGFKINLIELHFDRVENMEVTRDEKAKLVEDRDLDGVSGRNPFLGPGEQPGD